MGMEAQLCRPQDYSRKQNPAAGHAQSCAHRLLSPHLQTLTAQRWGRENSQSGASSCLVQQGFRNQTGVNSHLTLAH